MATLTNPRNLFLHELGDILFVEQKLTDEVLPKLIDEVEDAEFKQGLEKHLTQTRRHVANVEKVFRDLGERPETEKCMGFEGLKNEHDELAGEASEALVDLVDAGAAARTEHYEIAAYSGLIAMAKSLGERQAATLLEQNLKDEKETLRQVEKVTRRLAREHAKTANGGRGRR
jgi:ferritin-like metal-binding protein YciE